MAIWAALPAVASIGSTLFGIGAAEARAKAERRAMQLADQELQRIVPVMRDQFDFRLNTSKNFADYSLGLARQGRDQTGAVADTAFNETLGERKLGTDEQNAAALQRISTALTEGNKFADAQKDARLTSFALSGAERDRQRGFQNEADSEAGAFLPTVGAAAQNAERASSAASRAANIDATMLDANYPTVPGSDARVTAETNRQVANTRDRVLGNATRQGNLIAYADAAGGENRRLSKFAEAVQMLRDKAQLSANALPAELAAPAVQRENAGSRYEAALELADFIANATTDLSQRYRGEREGIFSNFGDQQIASLRALFQGLTSAAEGEASGVTNASNQYEDRFSSLIREKAARIAPNGKAGGTLSALSSILGAVGGLGGGGFNTGPIANVPRLPSPTIPRTTPIPRIPDPVRF